MVVIAMLVAITMVYIAGAIWRVTWNVVGPLAAATVIFAAILKLILESN